MPRDRLDRGRLIDAIDRYGCVLIPALLPPELCQELTEGIDAVFDGFDRHQGGTGTDDPWFDAFIPDDSPVHHTRQWLRNGGGVNTADSPRLSDRWFGLLRSLGIIDLIADAFGEEPVTSLDKCALRRISPGDGIEWHQDGAFLGLESGALNLWVTLTDTATAPGLDIVRRRFADIVETGSGGATYDWSTNPETIAAFAPESPVVQPRLSPGDALIFDGSMLHRTTRTAQPGSVRYAIETWFFRPSRFPRHQQVPLALHRSA